MKKQLMTLIAMVLISSAAYSYDLNVCSQTGDFNAIGNCIVQGSFGGDPFFYALIMLSLMTGFMWQVRMPMGAAIGISLIMFFALSGSLGTHYQLLLNIAIAVIGILVGLAIMHFVRR